MLVETENARVAVPIGDEDGTVGSGNGSGKTPLIGSLKPGFPRSGDFHHHRTVGLHLYKEPVLCGRAFLHGRIEELLSVLLGVNHRMNFRIRICYGPDQTPVASQGRRRIGPIGSCRNKWGKSGLSCCDSRHAHERTAVELCHWMLLTPLSAVGTGSAGVLKRYR